MLARRELHKQNVFCIQAMLATLIILLKTCLYSVLPTILLTFTSTHVQCELFPSNYTHPSFKH
jgi:hypothetical protein